MDKVINPGFSSFLSVKSSIKKLKVPKDKAPHPITRTKEIDSWLSRVSKVGKKRNTQPIPISKTVLAINIIHI
ncbi:hypothetical protein [Nostoc sp.]|uniref:hypothetical protein n=1 Tax=Nostoc sp. TaxID=1180 RepID=UPI002FF90BCE